VGVYVDEARADDAASRIDRPARRTVDAPHGDDPPVLDRDISCRRGLTTAVDDATVPDYEIVHGASPNAI
jgi:hypothetical protein